MRMWSLALLAIAPSALAAFPANADTVAVTPSTPWNVDFAEDRCRLARLFGEGEGRHFLFFEQYWPGERLSLMAAGPEFSGFRSRQTTRLKFFESQETLRTEPFTGSMAQFGNGVVYSSVSIETGTDSLEEDTSPTTLPALDTEFAERVEFVSLDQRGKEIQLITGPLDEAFEVLNTCTESLVAAWGLDLEKHLTATRMPRWTNEREVVRKIGSSYPRSALNRGEQGIMRMRVTVGEDGRVKDCKVIKATETDRLESPACEAMSDAQFEPALDSEGRPMRSYYATSIVYQMRR